MSLNRMIARMAVTSALSLKTGEVYPTIANQNVFDSRIATVEEFSGEQVLPIIVIYTDYDRGAWRHGSSFTSDRLLTFTFELLVASIDEVQGQEDVYAVNVPTTDSENETSLDIMEVQIQRALSADNVAAECFRRLVPVYKDVTSRRGASQEGGSRLSVRQITLETEVLKDFELASPPAYIGSFLDFCEQGGPFVERIPVIRDQLSFTDGLTQQEREIRSMSLNDRTSEILGLSRGPSFIMPSNVVWLNPDGNPAFG